MDEVSIKPRPNHAEYLRCLQRMTPEEKLAKAFELTEFSRSLFRQGLRQRFPDLDELAFHQLYLARLAKCHNRNC